MFAEKAFELIKEHERNPDNLTPFNVNKNIALCLVCLSVVSNMIFFSARMRLCVKFSRKSRQSTSRTIRMRKFI